MLIGDERHPVREGSVTYFPPGTPHQYFNESTDAWAEHLIITFPDGAERQRPARAQLARRTPAFGVHGDA